MSSQQNDVLPARKGTILPIYCKESRQEDILEQY